MKIKIYMVCVCGGVEICKLFNFLMVVGVTDTDV